MQQKYFFTLKRFIKNVLKEEYFKIFQLYEGILLPME